MEISGYKSQIRKTFPFPRPSSETKGVAKLPAQFKEIGGYKSQFRNMLTLKEVSIIQNK